MNKIYDSRILIYQFINLLFLWIPYYCKILDIALFSSLHILRNLIVGHRTMFHSFLFRTIRPFSFYAKKLKAQFSQEIKRTYCRDIVVSCSLLSAMNHLHQMPHNSMPKQYLWSFTIHVSYVVCSHLCTISQTSV